MPPTRNSIAPDRSRMQRPFAPAAPILARSAREVKERATPEKQRAKPPRRDATDERERAAAMRRTWRKCQTLIPGSVAPYLP
jgi:hypothetical protein